MWRSLFLAIGLTLVMLGVELFFVDQVEIMRLRRAKQTQPNQSTSLFQTATFQNVTPKANTLVYQPQDWMPWSLLAVGSIVLIYTYTIPKRKAESS